jgi:hypothetical protein
MKGDTPMPDGLDGLLDDDSTANPGQGGGALRKQLETALAELKTARDQLAAQTAKQRESAIGDLFSKHAIPELARDFFPADADLTDEAATAFVEKYGALWGAQAQPATTPPAAQAQAAAAQQFVAQARTPATQPLSEEDYAAKFAEAKTKGEFMQMLAEINAAASAGA